MLFPNHWPISNKDDSALAAERLSKALNINKLSVIVSNGELLLVSQCLNM